MSAESKDGALGFTGERFTPECVREIWYEHWHRYAFAAPLARGMDVLDAACGEGYGSAALAATAASVLGLDVDGATIEHARQRYAGVDNLCFDQADVTAGLENVPDACLDMITCFETLEHVEAQEALLDGFLRVLKPSGLLLISSPDKATYSDSRDFHNEFHVRELYREEFRKLLQARFAHLRFYGQKLLFLSAMWPAPDLQSGPASQHGVASERGLACSAAMTQQGEDAVPGLAYAPLYHLAVCSRRPLPETLPELSLFGDQEESVYAHYNDQVRKNMAAGHRIAELEQRIAELEGTRRPWWRRLFR